MSRRNDTRRRGRRRRKNQLPTLPIVALSLVVVLIIALVWSCSGSDGEEKQETQTTHRRPGAPVTTTAETDVPAPSIPKVDENGNPLVQKITLDTYSLEFEVGDERRYALVTMTPAEAPDKREIWTTSDPTIIDLDPDDGWITPLKPGQCTVTVKAAANPMVKATVKVTVKGSSSSTGTATTTTKPTSSSTVNKPDTPTVIDGIIVVNKSYPVSENYAPGDDPEAMTAFEAMRAAAAKQGLTLYNSSSYRSYWLQDDLYTRYSNRDGQAAADTYSARPGHSEHQTGLAIDLNQVDDSFAGTPEAIWVAENAHHFGFIVRYPKGKEHITGYQYEPWHIRYLGIDTATKVYESGKTLEEYLNIDSKYSY